MGVIMKNGVPYGGSSDDASSVAFDDTQSQLNVDNVQNALDKLSEKCDATDVKIDNELNSKLTYGASDLMAGTSKLATGTFYFVYE